MTTTQLFNLSASPVKKAIQRFMLRRKLSGYQKAADVEYAIAAQARKNAAWFEKQAIIAASDLRRIG